MPKLAAKFYGPFQVKDRVGKGAYQLELPSIAQIHDIFHVSRLKKAHGTSWQFHPLPTMEDSSKIMELGAIFNRQMVKRGNQAAAQLLIPWKNSSPAKATWEFASEIRRRFPAFSLEDKGYGKGRSCYEETGDDDDDDTATTLEECGNADAE